MTDMPKCHYCGKFVTLKTPNVVAEYVYGHLDIEDTIFYHKKCKPKTMKQDIQDKIDAAAQASAQGLQGSYARELSFIEGANHVLSHRELMREQMEDFANWINDNCIVATGGEWRHHSRWPEIKTTSQVFDLYLEHLNKKA